MSYPTVTIGTTKVPWPALAACLAAAPVIAVVGIRSMAQGRGQTLAAADDVAKGQFIPPSPIKPSGDALTLLMTFNSESAQPLGTSPMVSKAPPPPPPPPAEVAHASQPQPQVQPQGPATPTSPPQLSLTSILGGKGQSFAIINGKRRGVGDQVGNGFAVTSIDSSQGIVEVGNGTSTVTLQLKSLKGE
jgi:hypothetical protein